MSNVFTSIPEDKNNINVNVFDWYHEFNMTAQIGEIKPCLSEKLPPKSSISIRPKYAFQLMPMAFPIQTTIVSRISFYKMPVRALWKNHQDWVSSVNQQTHSRYVPPFVNFSSDWSDEDFNAVFGTKSLADYFNMPTTFDDQQSVTAYNYDAISQYIPSHDVMIPGYTFESSGTIDSPVNNQRVEIMCISNYGSVNRVSNFNPRRVHLKIISPQDGRLLIPMDGQRNAYVYYMSRTHTTPYEYTILDVAELTDLVHVSDSSTRTFDIDAWCDRDLDWDLTVEDTVVAASYVFVNSGTSSVSLNASGWKLFLDGSIQGNLNYDKTRCPWYNSATGQGLKVSALPWRMYDAVYNTFIRNIRNNPLYDIRDTTLPLYNKVTQLYDLPDGIPDFTYGPAGSAAFATREQMLEYATTKFANWEFDQFTTAVQTPMEGVAPLVGLTTFATSTTLEDGSVRMSLNQYVTDEDGKRYQVNMVTDEEGIQSVNYTEVQQVNGTPITSMYQAISEGISIADLRNVNAYTRYLEMNQRRGYRYKDIIEGRYDVKVRFDELLMPEFIGGFTREVRISPITQTVETSQDGLYNSALGSKAGDGFVFGESNNAITTYCDETSIILGIISFTPRPVYTQTINKWLLDRDILDEWSPEFNALGFQPILNREVAPIQYFVNSPESLDKTFGYQRPWYHMCEKYDTAHGDYRSSLRNFLMHRVFSGSPKLNKAFMIVKPDQVNDVFVVTENTDKIFGQIAFDITVKTGVSRSAVPRLE